MFAEPWPCQPRRLSARAIRSSERRSIAASRPKIGVPGSKHAVHGDELFDRSGLASVSAYSFQAICLELHRDGFRHEIGAPHRVSLGFLDARAELLPSFDGGGNSLKSLLSCSAHRRVPKDGVSEGGLSAARPSSVRRIMSSSRSMWPCFSQ